MFYLLSEAHSAISRAVISHIKLMNENHYVLSQYAENAYTNEYIMSYNLKKKMETNKNVFMIGN